MVHRTDLTVAGAVLNSARDNHVVRLLEEGDRRGAPGRVATFVASLHAAMHAAARPCVGS